MTKPVPTPFADLDAGAFGRRKPTKSSHGSTPSTSKSPRTRRADPASSESSVLAPSAPKPDWSTEERDRSYLDLTAEERLTRTDQVFVYDDQAYATIMVLEKWRKSLRARGNLIIMAGPPGTGKTELTTRYAARFKAKRMPSYDTVTVARAELFGLTPGPDLLFAILNGLGHPGLVRSSNPYEALRLIGEWAARRETEMVVVDAADRLCPNGHMPEETANLISAILARRLVGTLVLAGDTVLQTAVDANPQLRPHVRRRLPFADLAFEDEAEAEIRRKRKQPLQRDQAINFLSYVAWDLPFDPNGLDTETMTERFVVASDGNRETIMNLIYGGADFALTEDPTAKVFGLEHLAAAFAELWPDRTNPFLTHLPPRKGVPLEILEDMRKRAETLAALNR
jgi:hypothetical protein